MLNYVIYGEASHFQGKFQVAGYVVDGQWYHATDPAEAKTYAKTHPAKWIQAGTHPACGVAYSMPKGAKEMVEPGGRTLPFAFNPNIQLSLEQALELPAMHPRKNLIKVTGLNPYENDAYTLWKFVPDSVFDALANATPDDTYQQYNGQYDVVSGSSGGVDYYMDEVFEDTFENFMTSDAKADGWTDTPPSTHSNDRRLTMLILFDD